VRAAYYAAARHRDIRQVSMQIGRGAPARWTESAGATGPRTRNAGDADRMGKSHGRLLIFRLIFDAPVRKHLKCTAASRNENGLFFPYSDEGSSRMNRGDLANLAAFIAVADQRSFRAAASRLDVTPSALSHSMRQLEERLGVRLLHRTTRSVSVTDAGQRLLDQIRPAIDQITGAIENAHEGRLHPSGRLRIYAMSHLAATAVVVPVWQRFMSTYPEVQLELRVGDDAADIVAKGFDAAIGPRDRAPADMIVVQVMGPMKISVVGAPAYFAQRKPPRTLEDLARHSCIQYRVGLNGPALAWPFRRNGKTLRVTVDGRLMVNDADMALRAAADGIGLALTPKSLADPLLRSGQLIEVLDQWSPSVDGICIYYPGHRQVPASLRAFIDLTRAIKRLEPPRTVLKNPFTNI
jgi:DNA-binding transcriptional LysR family regulator